MDSVFTMQIHCLAQKAEKGDLPAIKQFGGKVQIIEGSWSPKRVIVQQWPGAEKFKEWYESEDYRPWKELRFRLAVANFILVESI